MVWRDASVGIEALLREDANRMTAQSVYYWECQCKLSMLSAQTKHSLLRGSLLEEAVIQWHTAVRRIPRLHTLRPLSWSESMYWKWLWVIVVLGCATLCWRAEPVSPYAGQEKQAIKAQSDEETQGYLSGSGMGFAKAAELNHYPGPRHVLDLAEPLQLSEEQRHKTQAIFEAMRTETVRLGQELVDRERHLDMLFAAGTIAEAQLEQLVADLATIHGQLRTVHLRAHLAQRAILTPEQLRRYDALRGYDASSHHPTHPQHGH